MVRGSVIHVLPSSPPNTAAGANSIYRLPQPCTRLRAYGIPQQVRSPFVCAVEMHYWKQPEGCGRNIEPSLRVVALCWASESWRRGMESELSRVVTAAMWFAFVFAADALKMTDIAGARWT
jgi:hypothetical protein